MDVEIGDDRVRLPGSVLRFPLELRLPAGFVAHDPATWPSVVGRLEHVGGRLLYMPPCADVQQYVVTDVAFVLRSWSEDHPEFVVGSNEAGMILGGETRAADAAVWRRADVGPASGHLQRLPPVLAVEVAGEDEGEPELRDKAGWYLAHGVSVVWVLLPARREVVVLRPEDEHRHAVGERLPGAPELPGLEPEVSRLFAQIHADRR